MTYLASITQNLGERLKLGCAARSGVALRMAARLAIPMRQCLLLFRRSQTRRLYFVCWLHVTAACLELQLQHLRVQCNPQYVSLTCTSRAIWFEY